MFVGWTGENQSDLLRCKDSQLSAPVGTSATETGNSVPFYINLILGCKGREGTFTVLPQNPSPNSGWWR